MTCHAVANLEGAQIRCDRNCPHNIHGSVEHGLIWTAAVPDPRILTVPDTAETVELVARALAEHEAGRDPLDALWMNAAGAILEALREASAGPGEGGA